MVYSAFAGQGVALAIAFTCHLRARWNRLLGERTGDVVAARTGPARSWPQDHLAGIAQAVAVLTVAAGLVSGYRAVGGSFGASALQPDPAWALTAAGGVGAAAAAAGLLGLAGRWGRHTRFWVPAGLTWIGSGVLAAFDGLMIVFFMLGTYDSETGWGPTDTVIITKVVIGLLAAAVGALAAATAAQDNRPHVTEFGEVRAVTAVFAEDLHEPAATEPVVGIDSGTPQRAAR